MVRALFLEQVLYLNLFLGNCRRGKGLFLNLLGFDGFLTQNNLHATVTHLGAAYPCPLL